METKPIIVRGNASVWLSDWMTKSETAADVIAGIATDRLPPTFPILSRPDANHSHGSEPWLKIGTAEIVLALTPPDTIAADEIRALQASLEAMRAQHHLAQQALLNRISKLQAISYEAA